MGRILLLALLPVLLAGCGKALKEQRPEKAAQFALSAAESAALNARRQAERAERLRDEVERLSAEVRRLLARADDADKRCLALINEIPKKQKVIYIRKKAPEKKESEKDKAKKEKDEKRADPEYSPSDAPLTPEEREQLGR